jgi:hypothetical protein
MEVKDGKDFYNIPKSFLSRVDFHYPSVEFDRPQDFPAKQLGGLDGLLGFHEFLLPFSLDLLKLFE